MAAAEEALILDLVEWVSVQPRSYDDVMAAWRTSCPRLTIWEDAVDRKLLAREHRHGIGAIVHITPAGQALLTAAGRWPKSTGSLNAAPAPPEW
jgi:hypothetical protein